MKFELPIKTISEANCRDHWRVKSDRVKLHRHTARMMTLNLINLGQWKLKEYPVQVRLTRIGKRMLDTDNLAGACKACRDGIADALGINDGDTTKIQFSYAQTIGKAYGVIVEIE